jgi:hypothetical protein
MNIVDVRPRWRKLQILRRHRKVNAIVHRALKQGILKRGVCLVCRNKKVVAHHENYRRPLLVFWLCYAHHWRIHFEPYELFMDLKYGQYKSVVTPRLSKVFHG